MTGNRNGIELRRFARRIGLTDTGRVGRLPAERATEIGVLRPFAGVLDAPVRREGGPPVDLSYLALAPVVHRVLAAQGGSDAGTAGIGADASDQDRGDSSDSNTELTVREVLRESTATDGDVGGGEPSTGDDGDDEPIGPVEEATTVTNVETAWPERTRLELDRPRVSGPRRTVLNVTPTSSDALDGAEPPAGTTRFGDPDQHSDESMSDTPTPVEPTMVHRSVGASADMERVSITSRSDRSGANPVDEDAPSVPSGVWDVDAPRLTLPSSAGTPRGAPGRMPGQGRPEAAVGGSDVGGPDAVGGVGSGDTTAGPSLTVRRTADTDGSSGDRAAGVAGDWGASPMGLGEDRSSGRPDQDDRGGDSALLTALREGEDADRLVDELYRALNRRMAIERDRRGG